MTTKTITVTENAYIALKHMKQENESFSETIVRITKRRPLREFFGCLSPESGARLEKTIKDIRRQHRELHQKRTARLLREME